MEPSEIEALQAEGIAAVKERDVAHGRALLLKVVANDDQRELAWLWLSVAMTTPADKEVALENVLTINPQNATARKRLDRLKKKQTHCSCGENGDSTRGIHLLIRASPCGCCCACGGGGGETSGLFC